MVQDSVSKLRSHDLIQQLRENHIPTKLIYTHFLMLVSNAKAMKSAVIVKLNVHFGCLLNYIYFINGYSIKMLGKNMRFHVTL